MLLQGAEARGQGGGEGEEEDKLWANFKSKEDLKRQQVCHCVECTPVCSVICSCVGLIRFKLAVTMTVTLGSHKSIL